MTDIATAPRRTRQPGLLAFLLRRAPLALVLVGIFLTWLLSQIRTELLESCAKRSALLAISIAANDRAAERFFGRC